MEVHQAANEITSTKTKGPAQMTMKDLKKVKLGQRLQEYSHKREELEKAWKSKNKSKLSLSQYYRVGFVMAVGALGVLGYYVYQSKKGDTTKMTPVHQSKEEDMTLVQLSEPQTHKFEME